MMALMLLYKYFVHIYCTYFNMIHTRYGILGFDL